MPVEVDVGLVVVAVSSGMTPTEVAVVGDGNALMVVGLPSIVVMTGVMVDLTPLAMILTQGSSDPVAGNVSVDWSLESFQFKVSSLLSTSRYPRSATGAAKAPLVHSKATNISKLPSCHMAYMACSDVQMIRIKDSNPVVHRR